MTASIRHRMEQELRTSQPHLVCTEPPDTSSTNPSPGPMGHSDSDFETESCHKFKLPPLQHLDDENEPKCGVLAIHPNSGVSLIKHYNQFYHQITHTWWNTIMQELPKASYSPQICDKLCLDDTSMKFGTQLEGALRKIFGYRAIADFSYGNNGGHLPKWPPPDTILSVAQVLNHLGTSF